MKVRNMLVSDKPAVMKILENTVEFKPSEVTIAEELIDAYLESGVHSGYFLISAIDEAEVVGYACFGETPLTEGTWDVYWIAVDKERQGKGIGKLLMSAVENTIITQSGRLILIETSSIPEYEKTRQFYYRIGYTVVCRIPDFYMPGDDKVVFRKIINTSI